MKRLFNTKKRLALLVSLVVVAASAIGAYAVFSSGGSGSGTATVGTSTAFTITGVTTSTLYPGTSTPVNFTVVNPGSGAQQLGTISLTGIHACVASTWDPTYTGGASCSSDGTDTGTAVAEDSSCETYTNTASDATANFSMADVAENLNLPPGSYTSASSSPHTIVNGSLAMNDLVALQDSCKNANLYLVFSA